MATRVPTRSIDGVISAVVFGSIALCAFLFDAAAVRLWFMKHYVGSALIGFIAAAALVVTFSNSLGSIVSRTDAVLAQRQGVAETRADNRRELLRLEKALADLGKFTPADDEAVNAAKRAADTSTSNKIAECDKRGPNCRQRELDEAAAATNLATVTAAKTATQRARQLEADIASVKAKLAQPISTEVGAVNPLGTALANLIGSAADVLTSWQQAIVALVFELCLVGVMVIYELLSHSKPPAQTAGAAEKRARARSRPANSAQAPIEASRPKANSTSKGEGRRRKCFALHQRECLHGQRCQDGNAGADPGLPRLVRHGGASCDRPEQGAG